MQAVLMWEMILIATKILFKRNKLAVNYSEWVSMLIFVTDNYGNVELREYCR